MVKESKILSVALNSGKEKAVLSNLESFIVTA